MKPNKKSLNDLKKENKNLARCFSCLTYLIKIVIFVSCCMSLSLRTVHNLEKIVCNCLKFNINKILTIILSEPPAAYPQTSQKT